MAILSADEAHNESLTVPNAWMVFTVHYYQEMPKKVSKGIPIEWLDLAMKQAKYIHGSDEIAEKIVREAGHHLAVKSTRTEEETLR